MTNEERFESLLLHCPDAVLLVNTAGEIRMVNRPAAALFGYGIDELQGMPVEELVPQTMRDWHTRKREGFAAEPRIRTMGERMDIIGLRKDGTELPMDIRLTMVEGQNGEPWVVCIAREISHLIAIQKKLEARTRELAARSDELATKNDALEEALAKLTSKNVELAALNEGKNQLLGIAAHDLRNPLGAIRGMAQLLGTGMLGPVTDRQEELIGRIQRSSEYMLQLVNDMLDFAAIESGKVNIKLERVELCEQIEQAVLLQGVAAARKSIQIEKDCLAGPIYGDVDIHKFEQVAHNLLSNAIKFSDPGTTIRVGLRAEGARAVLSVEDEGVGIPPDKVEDLCEPFARASRATAGEKSTGLGLAICQRIVEGHGGQIRIWSEVGEGSKFEADFPLAD